MRLQVVTVPYRYDERDSGSGGGPQAMIEAGLVSLLEQAGFDVQDPLVAELPDTERVDGPIAVNVGRLGAHTAEHVHTGLQDGGHVFVVSGDDTATVGIVSGLQRAHGAGAPIGVVWLDAHGDFNTPETSYSNILAGMPVAILAGLAGPLWRGAAGLAAPVPTDRILIAGVRELDEREATLLRSTDVQLIRSEEVSSGDALGLALRRLERSCEVICLHVDLDLLDPSLVPSSATPCPDGLTVDLASRLVRDVLATGKVAVLSLAGLNPGAGPLGKRSLASAMELIELSVPAWRTSTTPQDAHDGS